MMPDANKQVLHARTSSHSDVADTPAARARQGQMTEKLFGEQLLRYLREHEGEVRLKNLREEWISTDDGLVYEISVDAQVIE